MSQQFFEIKTALAATAILISTSNFFYYLYSIFRSRTRPHVYSWLIWGSVTLIAGLAQFFEKGGAGAWVTLLSAFYCYTRALIGLKYGEKNITKSDKFCLAGCLIAIIMWKLTANPLISVVIATLIDVAGFYPTVRKSWDKPYEENVLSYTIFGLTTFLGLMALDHYNLTTLLYPLVLSVSCMGFVIFLLMRRVVSIRDNNV
jgi:hypothetical protein